MSETTQSSEFTTVSGLARQITRAISNVPAGWIEGEVHDEPTVAGSGHAYLTLADEDAQIRCAIWRSKLQRIGTLPRRGELVQLRYSKVGYWPRGGSLTLHVEELRATGEGELLRRRAATLERLQRDGLTDPARKPPLPRLPRRVGVIAARDSHALADVVDSVRRRFPPVDLVLAPSLVEGLRAPGELIDALAVLQDVPGVDVVVIARGGGSVADLVPFDDERLCRAIFACDVPVVTAVGHTKNRPNCDYVAAAFADVPRDTALHVVPSASELGIAIAQLATAAEVGARSVFEGNFDELTEPIKRDLLRTVAECRRSLAARIELISAIDLRRPGWGMVGNAAGQPISSITELAVGDSLAVALSDGVADAQVTSIRRSTEGATDE